MSKLRYLQWVKKLNISWILGLARLPALMFSVMKDRQLDSFAAGKLEITYEITGFDRILYSQKPSWENCEFSMEEENRAVLRVWEDKIYNKDQLQQAKTRLERKVKSFILAMEFALSCPLQYRVLHEKRPAITAEDGTIELIEVVSVKDEAVSSVAPSMPPKEIPALPLECERWVLTLAEAHRFGDYVEEHLKREYLIIEELWPEFKNEIDDANASQELINKIRWTRNFVSHQICHDEKVVDHVLRELPSAAWYEGKELRVKFISSDVSHRCYVSRYEVKAREIARLLVEKKITQITSSTNNAVGQND